MRAVRERIGQGSPPVREKPEPRGDGEAVSTIRLGSWSGNMANICEPLINVVTLNRLKLLISLNQNGAQSDTPFSIGGTRA